MIRRGVPIEYRTQVWTRYVIVYSLYSMYSLFCCCCCLPFVCLFVSLIYHYVGKLKDVRDTACGGISYYQTLLKGKTTVSKCDERNNNMIMYHSIEGILEYDLSKKKE